MLGIPQWAIGVGVVMLFITTAQIVRRLVLGPQPPARGLWSRLLDARDAQGLDEIEARLAELETLKQRVVELEERVDFAERMLASQREAQRLAPPQD